MDRTAIVAAPTVAVEETVLINWVDVIAGNAGTKRAFTIIERTRTLDISPIDLTILIVVDTVGALGGAGHAIRIGVDSDRTIGAAAIKLDRYTITIERGIKFAIRAFFATASNHGNTKYKQPS